MVDRLGAGTFGTVYRGHDSALARDVALKIIDVPASGEGLAVDAVAEGRMLARVRHPHVVSVYGADRHDGRVGVWMELIEGHTLEDAIEARGPLPVEEVVAIGVDLSQALHAVHAAGLLHRDLKTQNVMRDARDGRVVLMDFSAGRDQRDLSPRSPDLPVTIAGSPLYLAPECFEGVPASPRSDIYGLGVVLHRLATGAYPVDGSSLAGIAEAHRARAGISVPDLATVPATLKPTLARMLAADPARRHASAAEVAAAFAAGASSSRQGARRSRPWMAGLAVTSLVIGAVGVLAPHRSGQAPPVRTTSARLALTTPSAEARRSVERADAAMQAVDGLHADLARDHLSRADDDLARAVELDPRFAFAWTMRARLTEGRGRPAPEYLALAERALALAADASPAERAFIEGTAYRMRADSAPERRDQLQRAAEAYEDVLELVPGHFWSLRDLPAVYQRLRRPDDADRARLHAAEAHPGSLLFAAGAARAHLRQRDSDALRRVATATLSAVTPEMNRAPGAVAVQVAWLTLWKARDAWMTGQASNTLEALREIERDSGESTNDLVHQGLCHAYQALGRFDDARATCARIADLERRQFQTTVVDTRQERWAAVKAVIAPGGRVSPQLARVYEFLYIYAGLLDDAERHLPSMRASRTSTAWQVPRGLETHLQTRGGNPSSGTAWQVAQDFELQLRVAQGRHREALDLFAPLLVDERTPRLRMHEMVATARRAVGDVAGAISLLERFERDLMVTADYFSGFDWLRCMTLLAELYQQEGRTTEAARVAAKVRAMLAHADAEHPFTARLARLP